MAFNKITWYAKEKKQTTITHGEGKKSIKTDPEQAQTNELAHKKH